VVENRIGHLWTMREGKAARVQVFPRREEALENLGERASTAGDELETFATDLDELDNPA
jgi:hypothetical protein